MTNGEGGEGPCCTRRFLRFPGWGFPMLIKLAEGHEPESRTEGGQVGYVQGGRQVARSRVAPVYPRTAAQAAEVGGVVGAARAYAYDLDPADAATYAGESCEGLNEFESWIWVWSLMQWLLQSIDVVPSGGFFGACPVLDDAALDVEGGSLTVEVSTPASSPNSSVRLRVSRPLKAGRRPRPEDMRTIGTVTPGSPQDIGPSMIERFGSLPAVGSISLFGLVVADPVNPAGSCECEWEVEWVEPAGDCGVSAVVNSGIAFQSFEIDVFVDLVCGEFDAEVAISVLTPGWEVSPGGGLVNPGSGYFYVQDSSGTARTEVVVFQFSIVGNPGCNCTAGVTLTIEEMP